MGTETRKFQLVPCDHGDCPKQGCIKDIALAVDLLRETLVSLTKIIALGEGMKVLLGKLPKRGTTDAGDA